MSQNAGLMQGKRGVVLGVANNRSIAWGIAKACRAAGAEIALTWQGDALKKRVEPLARELDGILLGHCDVTDAATIDAVFDVIRGPIKTLAASGIGDFRYILKWNEYNAPMRRTVSIEEVGDSALYLLSDMSRGVTGEVHHVDSGYHVVGMKRPDAPDISLSNSLGNPPGAKE